MHLDCSIKSRSWYTRGLGIWVSTSHRKLAGGGGGDPEEATARNKFDKDLGDKSQMDLELQKVNSSENNTYYFYPTQPHEWWDCSVKGWH